MSDVAVPTTVRPARIRVLAAFLAVYTIWGSTYLAIRFADETLPPFLLAGARFLIAGAILYAWMRLRGAARPTRLNWRATAIAGALLLLGGNGMVVWAETTVPSSLAALLISMVPIWMAVLPWLRPGGARPTAPVIAGLLLGFAGVVLLVGPDELTGHGSVSMVGIVVILLASLSWAAGSLYSRNARFPASPLLGSGMEMLAGGALLLVLSLATGELGQLHLQAVSSKSLLALGFLIVFGSIIGFSAYVWLLQVSTPARVSTYAYVNPVVAVFLGWALANEPVTGRTLLAAAVIVAAVVTITTVRGRAGNSTQNDSKPAIDAAPALPVELTQDGPPVGQRAG